jgi:hypothetical protein
VPLLMSASRLADVNRLRPPALGGKRSTRISHDGSDAHVAELGLAGDILERVERDNASWISSLDRHAGGARRTDPDLERHCAFLDAPQLVVDEGRRMSRASSVEEGKEVLRSAWIARCEAGQQEWLLAPPSRCRGRVRKLHR